MPSPSETTAQQKSAAKSRSTVWVNHADVVMLTRVDFAGKPVVFTVRLRNGETVSLAADQLDQLTLGAVPMMAYPSTASGGNSASNAPEPSQSAMISMGTGVTTPVVEGRRSILAAITSTVKSFWRKIRKVFITRQPGIAAIHLQPLTGGTR